MGFYMRFVRPANALPDWYQPSEPEDPACYRLTFDGMFEVAAAMAAADLLDEEAPAPKLPRWPPRGLSPGRADELGPYLFDAARLEARTEPQERPLVAGFLQRFTKATARRSETPGRVPAYKFRSNDGWLVHPDECRRIADGLDAALAGRQAQVLRRLRARGYSRTPQTLADLLVWWAQYNRVAADHGGYRVW